MAIASNESFAGWTKTGRTLVLRIVQDAAHEGGREVTVGAVAEHLGVDPSVGSRVVSDCISAGYLVRAASQQDGRRSVLLLSPGGEELMDRFRRHQRAAFEQITADWSARDRLEFARLLVQYVESQDALRRHTPRPAAPPAEPHRPSR